MENIKIIVMIHNRLQNITKKLFFLLMMVLLGSTSLLRAEEVTIGSLDGAANNSYLPMNSLYEYSFSQQIYTADEIGMAGTINSITMWLYGNANLYEMPFDIYMVEVDKDAFASTSDWVTVTDSDIVYSGSVTVHNTEAEAYTFELDTPFDYSGEGNLLIAFNNNTGSWKSGLNGIVFGASDDAIRAIYARRDGTPYDITNLPSATSTTYQRNVVVLDIESGGGTRYQVSAVVNPEGAGTVTGAGKYYENSECTLTAIPSSAEYYFVNWTDEFGVVVSTYAAYTFTVTDNVTYVANFEMNQQFEVEVYSALDTIGIVTGEGVFYENELCTVFAAGEGNYLFDNWTINGEIVSTDPAYTFEVTGNVTLVANFVQFESTTLYDGAITNSGVPVWVQLAYEYTQSQCVMPAEDLKDLVGKSIKGLRFYVTEYDPYFLYSNFMVYMTEYPDETITSFMEPATATTVYYGMLSMVNNEMTITFDTPYDYFGGNLLIGINTVEPQGTTPYYTRFYGVDKRDAGVFYAHPDNVNFSYYYPNQSNFLPKTMFFFDGETAPLYEITAVAEPEEAGYVVGAGNYSEGQICTLTAVKNSGYSFVNWTLNGEEVSTDATYTFEVTGDADYVANFVEGGMEDIELTVYDGTVTNNHVPMYVFYFDDWTRSQYIIPAEDLMEINGGVINAIKFYTNENNIPYTTVAPIEMYLAEVSYTSIDAFINKEDAQIVYSGYVNFTANDNGGETTIEFETPFTYYGGNLLVGCENTSDAGYKNIAFYGQNVEGASISGSNGSSTASVTATQQNFIPKTTFYASVDYTPAELVATPDPIALGYRPNGAWMMPFVANITNEGGATAINDVFVDNDYFQVELNDVTVPFVLPNGAGFSLNVSHGEAEEGEVNATMTVYYKNYAKQAQFNVSAIAYNPVAGDVWENAIEVTGFPYAGTAPADIYYNYNIPGGNPEANDVVYKVTVDELSMLNVSTTGANSAIAVYPEDFMGIGGPDQDNTYTYSLPMANVPGEGEWYYYDDGVNQDAIGTGGGSFWWGVMFPAGSYDGNYVTKVSIYDYAAMTGTVTIYNDGDDAPAVPVGEADVVLTGSNEFVEIEFVEPIVINPDKNIWVVYYNGSGTAYPASVCNNTGDANGRWVSLDGSSWNDLAGYGLNYSFMIRACIAQGAKGEVAEITLPKYESVNTGTLANAGVAIRGNRSDFNGSVALNPGTYYVVVSSTDAEFPVNISLSDVPAPVAAEMGYPANNAVNVAAPFRMTWTLGYYTQEMQVLMGTTNPPTDVLIDWTDQLVRSTTVNELENNKVYYVQINERNYTGTTEGVVTSFTSYLDVPEVYTDHPYYAYEDENLPIYWNPIEDEAFLSYNIYLNDTLINNTTDTLFTLVHPAFNLSNGYYLQVTAVYSIGESEKADGVFFYVSGYGNLAGFVYEQDGETPVADASVYFEGIDVFGMTVRCEFTTNEEGFFSGQAPYAQYDGYAYKEGYQMALHPQVYVDYNQTTEGVNFIMNEAYYPVAIVNAEEVDNNAEITWSMNGDRSLQFFRVYRADAYTQGNMMLIADSVFAQEYTDAAWDTLEMGTYQYGVSALYMGNAPVNRGILFSDDFESGDLSNWTTIDADGDGNDWGIGTPVEYGIGEAYSGDYVACSWSWNNSSYDPDNYMISPLVNGAASIQYFVATNTSYPDHYGLYVSLTGTETSDFTKVFEETVGAKGSGNGTRSSMTKPGTREISTWFERNIELPAGTKYVAFRHWDSYDMNYLFIDDVVINGASGPVIPGLNESSITWSNFISKDMYLGEGEMSVTVTLNSGDSPEGALVTLYNTNDNEQYYYPVEPIVLDETGVYTWDNFRKGEYYLVIEKEGYYDYDEFLTIYNETAITAELTEITEMVSTVYVSPTGWAMWDMTNETRHFAGYNVVLISEDGSVLYDEETTDNQMQLPVDDLVEGATYLFEVAKEYSSDTTEYVNTTFVYSPCENYEGAESVIYTTTEDGKLVTWNYNGEYNSTITFNLYDTYGDGWNGGYLTIMFGDGSIEDITCGDGYQESFSYQIAGTQHITAVYTAGSWSNENYLEVKTDDGEVLAYCDAGTMYTGMTFEFDVENIIVMIIRDGEFVEFVADNYYLDADVEETHEYSIRIVNPDYAMACEQVAEYKSLYNITATANEGGLVNGEEVFTATMYEDSYCTLEAEPYYGYAFNNWTIDGEVVSTDPIYTFVVEETVEIEANFVDMSNYFVVDPNAYEFNMTLTGIVKIDGVEQANAFLEVGALSGDEVRGSAFLEHVNITIGDNIVDGYFVSMTLYGNDGDELTFALYDHVTSEVLDIMCTNDLTFEANDNLGTLLDPYAINFMNVISVDYTFTPGWNWWSTHIELTAVDGMAMLEEGIGENATQISAQSAFTNYYAGYGWYGSLTTINNESMYRVQMNAETTFSMVGPKADPVDHPITMTKGWNHIGYVSSVEMSVNDALTNITAQQGDMVKSQKSYANYYEGYGWYGSLNTVKPGDGLMYKSTSDDAITFTYPVADDTRDMKANLTGDNNHWVPNVYSYPNNMTVMAVVEMNGEELASDNYELAAFVDGECRGSIQLIYAEPLNRYVAFMTVSGDEVANMTFGLFNIATGEESFSTTIASYSNDAMLGNPGEPFVVSFNNMNNDMTIYPNPVNKGEQVRIMTASGDQKVVVEIINALGKIVSVETVTSMSQGIAVPEAAGVYTIRLISEGNDVKCQKLVVR